MNKVQQVELMSHIILSGHVTEHGTWLCNFKPEAIPCFC